MSYSPEDDKYVIVKESPQDLMFRHYWTGHGWTTDVTVAERFGALSARMRLADLRRGAESKIYAVSLQRWQAHVKNWKRWYAIYVEKGLKHVEASVAATKATTPVNYKLDGE